MSGLSSKLKWQIPSSWPHILWREWRNCEDEEYAHHLFEVVANGSLDWKNQAIVTLLGILFGVLVGLLLDLILLPTITPMLIWFGGIIGGGSGFWLSRRISLRYWLAALTPNNLWTDFSNVKASLLIGLIIGFFIIPNILLKTGLLLGLVGGAILGLVLGLVSWPLLWLISLRFFQGEMLTPKDVLLSLAAVGISMGIGVWLGTKPNPKLDYEFRGLCFWWRERPLISEVIVALQQACQTQPRVAITWEKLLSSLKEETALQLSPEKYMAMLRHTEWGKRFIARYALITCGGEVVGFLRNVAFDETSPLQQTALWLLQGIEQDTTTRIIKQMTRPLCVRCLLRCQGYGVSIYENFFTYYGCRVCHQSQDILDGEIVAVLDSTTDQVLTQQDDQVRVNWLENRNLFDFDRVEIIQASDEDVERFAVQAGNDTDPFRASHYREIPCRVGPKARLSENSLRVLDRIFGRVERG